MIGSTKDDCRMSKPILTLLVLSSVALIAGCASAQAPPTAAARAAPADMAALQRTLDALANAHRGIVGYTVIDVESGARISRRGDETFSTASLIKVAILVTAYELIEKKQLSLDDPLTLLRIDKVPGSGILQHLHDGTQLTVGDALWLMSTISDNTATNLLLDRIIIRRVWDKMESLGLMHTKVHSKSFLRSTSVAMDSSVKYGFGVTTPTEMATLFQLLAQGKAVGPSADSAMLHVLEHGTYRQMLQRYILGVRSAFKDGETDEVRTECSLFHFSRRVVGCVLTKQNHDKRWVIDNEAQLLMARMGAAIASAFGGATTMPPSVAGESR
jgi:beta-lactamase class A